MTEKYTNWQPMFSSGGRRIKRSFYIDQSSISFATQELVLELKNTAPLRKSIETMLEGKEEEIGDINEWLETKGVTNLQLFRKYMLNWIKMRGDVRPDMYLVIRTMPPTPMGLPVELYCFTREPLGFEYEETQSENFLSILMHSAKYF
ncbi:mechanosensitive ion channel [Shigella sp. FC1967]|nr:mechanosensitive ion channel [Shigella sp. FC1967]